MNLTKGLLSIAGLIFLSSAYSINSFSNKELQIVATNYQLAYTIDIKDEKLFASGNITVKNISSSNANHIPLRLYRMLKVSQILNEKGKDLPFSQQILSNDNWPEMQTNYIEISLENQLKPNEYMTISIQYEGQLRGYAETGMLYVKDRISEDFSLIRRETKTYPIIGYPNYNVNSKVNVFLHLFDYQVSMTVPQGYVVANGGELIEKSSHKNQITYSYKNKMPAWRMDFAIAKYKVYSKDIYTIYSWENKKKCFAGIK